MFARLARMRMPPEMLKMTSNARVGTRSALSRRSTVSGPLANSTTEKNKK